MLNPLRVALVLFWLISSAALAQAPDPRDSVILESKVLAPGLSGSPTGNPPAFTMKVYITNKDTVGVLTLALRESTTIGNAYADLDSIGPAGNNDDGWTIFDCVTFLKITLNSHRAEDFSRYDGSSPDRFFVAATWSPTIANPVRDAEPPNAVRSAIWELRFMSTDNALGEVIVDRATNLAQQLGFTILRNRATIIEDIPVNFLPGVITVVQPRVKGDFNLDFELRPADIGLHLNCVMLGAIPPVGKNYCDLNCDGGASVADVVLMIIAVYQKVAFPFPC